MLYTNIAAIAPEQEKEYFQIAGPAAAWSRNLVITSLAETGDFPEALAHGKEAVRIASEANHSYTLVGAYFGLGYAEVRRGNLRAATDWLERGMELSRVRDLAFQLPLVLSALSYAYAISGRLEEARELLSQAESVAPGSLASANMGWTGLCGDLSEALALDIHHR